MVFATTTTRGAAMVDDQLGGAAIFCWIQRAAVRKGDGRNVKSGRVASIRFDLTVTESTSNGQGAAGRPTPSAAHCKKRFKWMLDVL